MLLPNERQIIAATAPKLVTAGLTTGSGGNISVVSRQAALVAITPSGVAYDQMRDEDVVVSDLSGQVQEGHRRPSSELAFHLAIYHARSDIGAVVHTHSVYATTFACLHKEIPPVHYLVGFCGNKVPLAPYATFGTPELAENVVRHMGSFNAVLMANHGLVAVGPSLARAFAVAEEIELVARLYYQALNIGRPKMLSDAEMMRVMEKFKSYGEQ